MNIIAQHSMLLTLLALVSCCAGCHGKDSATAPTQPANTLTLDEVYAQQITSLIGQEIVLYEEVAWQSPPISGIPSYSIPLFPTCVTRKNESNEIEESIAWLDFGNVDSYINEPEQGEGNVEIYSDQLKMSYDAINEKHVHYQEKELVSGKPYYLVGSFEYAPWIEVQANADQSCLQKLNAIMYWRHIFVFRLKSLSETPPQ